MRIVLVSSRLNRTEKLALQLNSLRNSSSSSTRLSFTDSRFFRLFGFAARHVMQCSRSVLVSTCLCGTNSSISGRTRW